MRPYKLIQKIEKWAVKYPNDVHICGIDDGVYANSILVFIEHKTKKNYHGTTVVVVPQCTGEPPMEYFMYPNHLVKIIKVLTDIRKSQLKYPRNQL